MISEDRQLLGALHGEPAVEDKVGTAWMPSSLPWRTLSSTLRHRWGWGRTVENVFSVGEVAYRSAPIRIERLRETRAHLLARLRHGGITPISPLLDLHHHDPRRKGLAD